MNLNIFRVLMPAEAALVQVYADRERWLVECAALAISKETAEAWDAAALAYAQTTLYPNNRVLMEARRAFRESVLRGEGMPAGTIEEVLHDMWRRDMAQALS